MARIMFFVCGAEPQGLIDAQERGWERIAAYRFAGPDKDDIRVVRRFSDLAPGTPLLLIKGSDYEENEDRKKFEEFVAAGHGKWVDG